MGYRNKKYNHEFQDLQKNGVGSGVEEQQRIGARKILEANN